MKRLGMTIPFGGVPLADQRDWYAELQDLGYTDLWSAESGGADAFTPLALAAVFGKDSIVGINLHIVTDRDRGVVVDGQVIGCTRRRKKHFDLLEVKLLLGHILGFSV